MEFRSSRRPKPLHFLSFILLVVLSALVPGRGAAQDVATSPRFGLVNAYENTEAARLSGAGWEIITLRWDEIQPSGPTDWTPDPEIDDWLSSARAAGREVVAVLVGAPAWATSGEPVTGVPRGLYLPVSDPGNTWGSFVSHAASYYGSQGVNRWVIWRDVDIPSGSRGATWDGSIEEYYQLVKVASVAAKNANPNALIHLGGVGSYDPGWFGRFLDIALDDPTAPGSDYYFDVATLHVFYSPESVYTQIRNHYYLMDQRGIPLKEVWLNETNARPAVDSEVYPEDATFREHSRVSMEQQAAFVMQAYALSFAAGGTRTAVYRLVDDLDADDEQAYGLVRADGSPRQAFFTYRLAVEQFTGWVYARRVEDTHPLIDYVRLTFANKVTHVAWALTEESATLIIPARTRQAALLDLYGNRWTVQPEDDGAYHLVVGGAECNDPAFGCLIGGMPWLLVEDGIANAPSQEPPPVTVEAGGVTPTPEPGAALTATALAAPTDTPSPQPTDTPPATETLAPTQEVTASPLPVEPTAEASVESRPPLAAEVTNEPAPQPSPAARPNPANISPDDVRPQGLPGVLPFLLIGLGVGVIGGGIWYFWNGRATSPPTAAQSEDLPAESEDVSAEGEEAADAEWEEEAASWEDDETSYAEESEEFYEDESTLSFDEDDSPPDEDDD